MDQIGPGARGRAVADVQTRLTALGFPVGPSGADGVFAEATEQAVRAFQQGQGMSVTGVVDGATWRRLVDASLSLGDRTVYLRRPHLHGEDIRQLQEALATLGFFAGTIDGVFGIMTENAVREFQRSVGLIADGIVGRATFAALANLAPALAARGPSTTPRQRRAVFGQGLAGLCVSIASPPSEGLAGQVARECGIRLGSLLELAGARVDAGPGCTDDTDVYAAAVEFRAGRDSDVLMVRLTGPLAAVAGGVLSKELGDRVGADMSSAESEGGWEIQLTDGGPGVLETLCQRVAVAVFDALTRAAESPTE